jgi:hypothetical protein
MYQLNAAGSIIRLEDGAIIPPDENNSDYKQYQSWVESDNVAQPADVLTPTQAQLDYDRYIRRAQAKDKILAEFASENMSRIRAGTWTVPNLVELTQDSQLNLLLANINTLSFELAISSIQGITNPLITSEIKAGWVAKLQAHLYLVP